MECFISLSLVTLVSSGLKHEQCYANAEDACVQPVLLLSTNPAKKQSQARVSTRQECHDDQHDDDNYGDIMTVILMIMVMMVMMMVMMVMMVAEGSSLAGTVP